MIIIRRKKIINLYNEHKNDKDLTILKKLGLGYKDKGNPK